MAVWALTKKTRPIMGTPTLEPNVFNSGRACPLMDIRAEGQCSQVIHSKPFTLSRTFGNRRCIQTRRAAPDFVGEPQNLRALAQNLEIATIQSGAQAPNGGAKERMRYT